MSGMRWRLSLVILFTVIFISGPASAVYSIENDDVLGRSGEWIYFGDARVAESELGNFAADALLEIFSADAAVIPGGLLSASLPAGEIDYSLVSELFNTDSEIVTAEISYTQFLDILENGISKITVAENEFIDYKASEFFAYPQVAGFSYTYDAAAPAGNRLVRVVSDNFKKDERIVIVTVQELAEGAYGYPPIGHYQFTGKRLSEATASYISLHQEVSSPGTGRSEVIGTNDNTVIRKYSSPAVIILVVIAFALISLGKKRWPDEDWKSM